MNHLAPIISFFLCEHMLVISSIVLLNFIFELLICSNIIRYNHILSHCSINKNIIFFQAIAQITFEPYCCNFFLRFYSNHKSFEPLLILFWDIWLKLCWPITQYPYHSVEPLLQLYYLPWVLLYCNLVYIMIHSSA